MDVIELFAGIGGFRFGLEQANSNRTNKSTQQQRTPQISRDKNVQSSKINISQQTRHFNIIWANELDKYACKIYRNHWDDNTLVQGDIRSIQTSDIPDHDWLVGGFPCQPFSLAGKREGFNDIRGTLFFEIARILKAKRPKNFLLENVKGLLSAQNGYCFWRILSILDELGYNVEWKVFNSKHYGVPQNRERVLIIGHFRGRSGQQIFSVDGDDSTSYKIGQIAGTLTGGGHSGGLHSNMTAIWQLPQNKDRKSVYLSNECIQALRTCQRPVNPKMIIHSLFPRTGDSDKGGVGHLTRNDDSCYALDTHNSIAIETAQALQTDGFLRAGSSFGTNLPQLTRNIRRLTPTECERLQGFPDGWTKGVSDTQRYKCLGNAVTVNVIEYVGQLILRNM